MILQPRQGVLCRLGHQVSAQAQVLAELDESGAQSLQEGREAFGDGMVVAAHHSTVPAPPQHKTGEGQADPQGAPDRGPALLRSVDGDPEGSGMDVTRLDVRIGDRLLICSDGLTDLVDDSRIETVLRGHDPDGAAAMLAQQALSAGGRDNITVVVVDVIDGPRVVGDGRLLGAVGDPRNIVDAAAVRLA